MAESKTKAIYEQINQVSQSLLSHEYYFISRGKRIAHGAIETSERYKKDVTLSIHQIIIKALINYNEERCLFCGQKSTFDQLIKPKNGKEFHIKLCNRCTLEEP